MQCNSFCNTGRVTNFYQCGFFGLELIEKIVVNDSLNSMRQARQRKEGGGGGDGQTGRQRGGLSEEKKRGGSVGEGKGGWGGGSEISDTEGHTIPFLNQ